MKDKEIIECLQNGGVVLLPTDTVYGLAASPLNEKGVKKIFDLKQRSESQYLPIMVSSGEDLEAFGLDLYPAVRRLLNSQFVPGDLTVILGFTHEALLPWLKGRIECAVRIPDNERLLEILKQTGPLLVTSANKHGTPITPSNVLDILEDLNGKPDLIIDGGIVENVPSTIVNCRLQPPVIERTGRISYEELQKILNNE